MNTKTLALKLAVALGIGMFGLLYDRITTRWVVVNRPKSIALLLGAVLVISAGVFKVWGQAYDYAITPLSLTNSVQTVKATAGPLIFYQCYNPNATAVYVQVFDIAGSVTLGTSVPELVINMQVAGTTGLVAPLPPPAIANAIKVAATTTPNGAAAPAQNVFCEFGYH